MLLHEGLTRVHSWRKPWLHFGESFTSVAIIGQMCRKHLCCVINVADDENAPFNLRCRWDSFCCCSRFLNHNQSFKVLCFYFVPVDRDINIHVEEAWKRFLTHTHTHTHTLVARTAWHFRNVCFHMFFLFSFPYTSDLLSVIFIMSAAKLF